MIFHLYNRASAGYPFHLRARGLEDLEEVLVGVAEEFPIKLLAYALMPTHWHAVLDVPSSPTLHAVWRWIFCQHVAACGGKHRIYDDRSGGARPVHTWEATQRICRYVERNPLTDGLVIRAELWRWTSLWIRLHEPESPMGQVLALKASDLPPDWLRIVNQATSVRERGSY